MTTTLKQGDLVYSKRSGAAYEVVEIAPDGTSRCVVRFINNTGQIYPATLPVDISNHRHFEILI